MTDTLQVNQLCYRRGTFPLIKDLTCSLSSGHWLHVKGSNGSGKTTLLRLLAGLLSADSGRIAWNEQTIQRQRIQYQAQLYYLGHTNGLKGELTAVENLCWSAKLQGTPITPNDARKLLLTFGLHKQADLPSQCLSQGQKRRVALAGLGYTQAKLWLLDEPFNALDAQATTQLQQQIQHHLEHAGLLVLSSHQDVSLPSASQQNLTLGNPPFSNITYAYESLGQTHD